MALETMGKIVPHSTAKTAASSTQLLNRNPLSRETTESSWFSLLRKSSRKKSRLSEKTTITPRKAAKKGPMLDCAKACTELTMPLRVRKVPKMERKTGAI